MLFPCIRLLCLLVSAVAQDLFLAHHGLTMQAANTSGTNSTGQLAVGSADSWWKTITPDENHMLCIDAPGGNAFNGNLLWLWECNGMDSQIWVFDNYQIRYGGDESFCIDAGQMGNGEQLMLWECNGEQQQTWGYDFDALRVYLTNVGICLDAFEGDTDNGQSLHVWECNGYTNQKWGIWDSGAPSGPSPSPGPGPTPGPADNVWPPHCGNNPDGWPVFNSPSDLQNDPSGWGNYFQQVYGEIPQTGYPICVSSLQYLVDYVVSSTIGISPDSGCPANSGDYYKMMALPFLQSHGSSWIWNTNAFSELPGDHWVEIIHTAFFDDKASSWMYYAAGSAIWFWTGTTKAYSDHQDSVMDMLGTKCSNFQCDKEFGTLFPQAASQGYNSLQYTAHYDMTCGFSGSGKWRLGAIEIVDVQGDGTKPCGSNYRAGWEASQDCNCQKGKFANCAGFGDQR